MSIFDGMRRNRALDTFELTPPRDYMRPPKTPEELEADLEEREQNAPVESALEHLRRFRRRSFDLPEVGFSLSRAVFSAFGVFLLLGCAASAPLGDIPSAQERFEDWANRHNASVVGQLPGDTPEPGSELYAAVHYNEQEQLELLSATPEPQKETESSVVKHYAPGELRYHSDKLTIDIEQKTKGNLTYFVADIQLTDVSQLRTAFAGDQFDSGIYEATSDIAARYRPVLAINADFCRYHHDGVIIRNGELFRRQNITKHHLMIVDKNGDFSALTDRTGKQGLVAKRLEEAETWQTFEFGPVLVENGEATKLPKSFFISCSEGYYEPRTGIGQIGPLHYIVIVVDGRREGYSTGASIPQFQQLFLEEGAQFAFNLDGGGSTTLYFRGEVVNAPSGNKERSVSDAILFMEQPQ